LIGAKSFLCNWLEFVSRFRVSERVRERDVGYSTGQCSLREGLLWHSQGG
jgi:hypothetical protein